MIHNLLTQLQSRFVSDADVAAYETTIPTKIHIKYKRENDTFIGFIDEIDGEKIQGLLTTQAPTYDEFVYNVNQLTYSYVNMPEKIRIHYGNRFKPPVNSAKTKGSLTLQKA